MRFWVKLAVAFAVFGLLILTVFAVQWYFLSREPSAAVGNYTLDETFTAESFVYGPQNWVPYATKLAVAPGVDVNGNPAYYLMFVDLNATSNLNATHPCVRVDYAFTDLAGTAAFHVYGYIKDNQGFSWTNRVDGDGASGFYVTAPQGTQRHLTWAQPMPDLDHICVQVSNKAGAAFNDFGNNTYYMKFEKAGGGLNSLHLTTDQTNPNGNVTTTSNQQGTFYVDYMGDRVQDDFVLCVAVSGTIGGSFQLNLKASVPS